jgi:Ca2+-binding RTX toxin-like protein
MSARNLFESLEGRRLFSAGITQIGGLITVFGDSSNDVCKVATDGPTVTVSLGHGAHSHTKKVSSSSVNQIVFMGFDGNDKFVNDTGIRSTAIGGKGNDTLTGGSNKDHLDGGDGADVLIGRAGNDTLKGGAGGDFLFGGSGSDYLDGGADSVKDYVFGQSGTDTFKERPGDTWDRVAGEPIVV